MQWASEAVKKCVRTTGMIAAALLLTSVSASPSVAIAGSDAEVQAAFLTKLAIFVKWPETAFVDSEAPIVTCALNAPKIARSLDSLAADTTVKGRHFEIRRIEAAADTEGCHMVVLGSGNRRSQRSVARQLNTKGLLTVATSRAFAEDGGMVGMEMHKGRIAFEVNNGSAKNADLMISSRLLRLASFVH